MRNSLRLSIAAAAAMLSSTAFAQTAEITLGTGVFPESIAVAPDGGLLVSSFQQGTVYRIAPGATEAETFVTGIGPIITGVFADQDTAYVCSNTELGRGGSLMTFDLASGDVTGSYLLPDNGYCTDIAAAPDGTIYVSRLNLIGGGGAGQLLRLAEGALEIVLSDEAIAGITGLAFIGDTLFAGDLGTGDLFRINLGEDPATWTVLTLSEPLVRPDGIRTTEDGTALLIADARANRIVSVTVDADAATIAPVLDGLAGPTGAVQLGNTVYVVEANLAARNGEDPGVFVVKAYDLTP